MVPGDAQPMLDGIKVVDLTSVVFGPYCTQILADYGAEVIKIEAPGGDAFRHSARPAKTPGMAPGFIALNRGKKSLVLDLKAPADAAILTDLLREADVFVHNVRAAAIERLGSGYAAVAQLNSEIIYLHCVGFGSVAACIKIDRFLAIIIRIHIGSEAACIKIDRFLAFIIHIRGSIYRCSIKLYAWLGSWLQ